MIQDRQDYLPERSGEEDTLEIGSNRLVFYNGETDFRKGLINPFLPTEALPGTPEKVAVLRERALARIPLWNPQDAKMDGGMGELQMEAIDRLIALIEQSRKKDPSTK